MRTGMSATGHIWLSEDHSGKSISGLECGWEGDPEARLDHEGNWKDQRHILGCCLKIFTAWTLTTRAGATAAQDC